MCPSNPFTTLFASLLAPTEASLTLSKATARLPKHHCGDVPPLVTPYVTPVVFTSKLATPLDLPTPNARIQLLLLSLRAKGGQPRQPPQPLHHTPKVNLRAYLIDYPNIPLVPVQAEGSVMEQAELKVVQAAQHTIIELQGAATPRFPPIPPTKMVRVKCRVRPDQVLARVYRIQ